MNILFISESYYPTLSGVPMVVKYLAEGLAKKHSVTIATTFKNENLLKEEIINGVRVLRFKIFFNAFKKVCGDIKEYQKFILKNNYDAIIVECAQTCTTNALFPIIKRINAKLILHAHGLSGLLLKPFALKTDIKHTIGNTFNWFYMKVYYNIVFKHYVRLFDSSISLTNCDSGYNYLSRYIPFNYVLGNAADSIFFENKVIPYHLPTDGMSYMLSIANYTVVKNQISLLRQYYKTKDRNCALVMIGSKKNAYYQQLEEEYKVLSNKYGERPVFMLTNIDRKYFPYILDNAKIYLVSSTYEEYSISIIEAMARSLPFISTNVGNAKLLPGGIVCNNINDFSNSIDSLLSDETRRKRLSVEAGIFAHTNCKREIAVKKLEEILIEVINR